MNLRICIEHEPPGTNKFYCEEGLSRNLRKKSTNCQSCFPTTLCIAIRSGYESGPLKLHMVPTLFFSLNLPTCLLHSSRKSVVSNDDKKQNKQNKNK